MNLFVAKLWWRFPFPGQDKEAAVLHIYIIQRACPIRQVFL